jgi:hypothetical protein
VGYQEKPTVFRNYNVYDIGAYPEPPICKRIKWRITRFDLIDDNEIKYLQEEMNRGK